MKMSFYLVSGILFGIGLSLSGMTDPTKVKGFLSIGFGDWNPALIFVMGSALIVYYFAFLFLKRRRLTLSGLPFSKPIRKNIDWKLIVGSALFGIGWGISGFCPGPALVHIAQLDKNFALFIAAMLMGFEAQKRMDPS